MQYVPILAEFSKIHGGIRVIVHVHNMTAKVLGAMAWQRGGSPDLGDS